MERFASDRIKDEVKFWRLVTRREERPLFPPVKGNPTSIGSLVDI